MQIETKEAMMLFEKKSKSMIRILRSNANNLEKSIIDAHTISSKYIEENKQETAASIPCSASINAWRRLQKTFAGIVPPCEALPGSAAGAFAE